VSRKVSCADFSRNEQTLEIHLQKNVTTDKDRLGRLLAASRELAISNGALI
jgi:hypothetical protein